MNNTNKIYCRMSAQALHDYGVEYVVTSPGSRNAPLLVALNREPGLKVLSVIDERSAAFIALGIATMTNRPVAIVCSSGSALLNYAPALSEAYYRGVPLIVLSADRTINRIDQNDSQTIRQYGALSAVVKASYDIREEDDKSFVNRKLNDAIQSALVSPQAPVHINIQISEPLNILSDVTERDFRKVGKIGIENVIAPSAMSALADEVRASKKVMILVGYHVPDSRFETAMLKLAAMNNITVLYEAQSNLQSLTDSAIGHIDITLNAMSNEEKEANKPDLLITLGGSVTSNFVKQFLRTALGLKHWSVGRTTTLIDTYDAVTQNIQIDDTTFVASLVEHIQGYQSDSDYNKRWLKTSIKARNFASEYERTCPWSDFKAMATVLSLLHDCNLQLSNGTAVRYTQLFDYDHFDRVDCNRGVSGIDGCTSTAIGAALVSEKPTVLITGDMCAQYDLGALAANCISPQFKMIVLNNGGGGIFRFIKATRDLEELDKLIACDVNLPLKQLAEAFGFAYFEADNENDLQREVNTFIQENGHPAMLNIITDGAASAEVLINFYNSKK